MDRIGLSGVVGGDGSCGWRSWDDFRVVCLIKIQKMILLD